MTSLTVEQMMVNSISSNPKEHTTHFLVVRPRDRHGQCRFKCIRCQYEFESCGRARAYEHITGRAYRSNGRHIQACPLPYLPLKEAWIKEEKEIAKNPSLLSKRDREMCELKIRKRTRVYGVPPNLGPTAEQTAYQSSTATVAPPSPLPPQPVEVAPANDSKDSMTAPPTTSSTPSPPPQEVSLSDSVQAILGKLTEAIARKARHKKPSKSMRGCISGIQRFDKDQLVSFISAMHMFAPVFVDLAIALEPENGDKATDLISSIMMYKDSSNNINNINNVNTANNQDNTLTVEKLETLVNTYKPEVSKPSNSSSSSSKRRPFSLAITSNDRSDSSSPCLKPGPLG